MTKVPSPSEETDEAESSLSLLAGIVSLLNLENFQLRLAGASGRVNKGPFGTIIV